MAHAAGVIIFWRPEGVCNGELTVENTRVLLVETKGPGNFGFPKGSHEKGETWTVTAIRELREESGLSLEEVRILGDPETMSVAEFNAKGNLGVKYLLGVLTDSSPTLCPNDPQEVLSIDWFTVTGARKKLVNRRAKVLGKAFQLLQSFTE